MSMFITNRTRSCHVSRVSGMELPSLITIVLEPLFFMFLVSPGPKSTRWNVRTCVVSESEAEKSLISCHWLRLDTADPPKCHKLAQRPQLCI